jgi:hypothetical protein
LSLKKKKNPPQATHDLETIFKIFQMGLPTKSFFHFSLLLFSLITIFVFLFPYAIIGADNTNLVYKGCADQKFPDPIYSQNLKTLLSSLVSQASQKTFYTTTTGGSQNAILGLYQCRGDLTLPNCHSCVTMIQDMADKLCGKAIAARIQLNGCYMRYEIVGFKQVASTELLYKVCGSTQTKETGFEQKRDTAFELVESGVKSGLFYTGMYESVYVLGQCEGDLGSDDCVDCVKIALERAKADCGDSISSQVYFHKCYISYSYYPNGVPSLYPSSGKLRETKFFVIHI